MTGWETARCLAALAMLLHSTTARRIWRSRSLRRLPMRSAQSIEKVSYSLQSIGLSYIRATWLSQKVIPLTVRRKKPPRKKALEAAMSGNRVAVAALVALSFALGPIVDAHAQAYPSRTIKIIVPVTPGSPVDALGRVVAQQLQARLGQG